MAEHLPENDKANATTKLKEDYLRCVLQQDKVYTLPAIEGAVLMPEGVGDPGAAGAAMEQATVNCMDFQVLDKKPHAKHVMQKASAN